MKVEKKNQNNLPKSRDIFLSHRSTDNDFVWKIDKDIEQHDYQGRQLLTWVDEAEIMPGQSVAGMINQGLENSRFIGLVMTPDYFASESGWTDAEWHSAISIDPDNRKGRIIPLLVKDCPNIPYLIRNLKAIDMRGDRYSKGLSELLMVLMGEQLPRPTPYRGQLITPFGRITRETLFVERSVPVADPDVTREVLHCNLIPVEKLPQSIYTAPISDLLCATRPDGTKRLPSKQIIKDAIRIAQEKARIERPFVPAFRVFEDRIVTFHDLEDPEGPLSAVIDDREIEISPTKAWIRDEDDRRILVSLLNMAVTRHLIRIGLVADKIKQGRFYFPPKDEGPNVIEWIPFKRRNRREVAGPRVDADGNVTFWRHLAAYMKLSFLANNFFLQIKPTWVFTDDGYEVKRGPDLSRLAIRWTSPERNINILYHVRFWTSILRMGGGPISIRAGDQFIEFSSRPAFIRLPYGILDDQRDLMPLLEDEIPSIERAEEVLIDLAAEEIELGGEFPPEAVEEDEEDILTEREDVD